jgi:hypothetical protein
MRTLSCFLLLTGALALGAGPALGKTKTFQTPSHKIRCAYMSTLGPGPWIRCDVLWLNDTAYRLDRTHKGKRIHVTDAVAGPHVKVVRYGTSLRVGAFTCTSRTTGLTCKSRVSRHGFTVSKEHQRGF